MTRHSIMEYACAVRPRYIDMSKKTKGKMLDEFTKVTGRHRKAAIRLLHRLSHPVPRKRQGRPPEYGAEVSAMLKEIWEASDRICSKRLQPFLPEMIKVLRRHDEKHINAATEAQLCRMSPSTIDRLLRPARRTGGRKPISTTHAGNLLKNHIPIRTFADWQENKPGFMEVDLVAHCGESTEGTYLHTLCAVDIASGWTECLPLSSKYQEKVRQMVHHMRQRLPFPLKGIDSDNGSEFINQCFYKYCHDEKITFTRSRSYKKNDSCYVEQKNGNVVRRFIGYQRYSTNSALECMSRVYDAVRMYVNFFQPTMKLVSKARFGSKVHRVYDTAQTPYQRLLRSGILSEAKQSELAAIYAGLNPVQLRAQLDEHLEKLWRFVDRSVGNRIYDATKAISVTV